MYQCIFVDLLLTYFLFLCIVKQRCIKPSPLEDLMKRGKDGTSAVKKAFVAPSAADSKRFGNIKFKASRSREENVA